MICKNCKKEFVGKFCPQCGQENLLFDKFKPFLYDQSEQVVAVLGNNIAQTFLSKGILGNGFAILSDKRVYFKGKCLIRRGKGFYRKSEEKSVDVDDITGTGFVHNTAPLLKFLQILFLALTFALCLTLLFSVLPLLFEGYADQVGETLLSFLPFFAVIGSLTLFFCYLYKRYNYSAFQISYAGGDIAFDMHWIPYMESLGFQKELNLLKDKMKAEKNPPVEPPNTADRSISDQLTEYKSLLDQGLITQEDLDTKKKQLLGL